MNVMIVGDEEKLVKILKFYFEKEGFNVFEALNGEDAIKKCDSNKIDLVILRLDDTKIKWNWGL